MKRRETGCNVCGGELVQRGKQRVCPPCTKKYQTAWRAKNADKIKLKARTRYETTRDLPEQVAYRKRYYAENKERIKAYKKELWARDIELARIKDRGSRKGISVEEYRALLSSQNGTCRICGETNGKRALCIDHNHTTGKVRALLCARCNAGVGMFRESPKLLHAAVKYLREVEVE